MSSRHDATTARTPVEAGLAALWTDEHRTMAAAEGWSLEGFGGTGLLQVRAVGGEAGCLGPRGHGAALAHVHRMARGGSELHVVAMLIDDFYDPLVYGPGGPGRSAVCGWA